MRRAGCGRSRDGGSVDPYGSATVRVRFDATELEDGLYEGQLGVISNDPVTPGILLPVRLTVASWVCGDVNNDGATAPNVADLTYLVAFLFRNGPPPPVPTAADCNGQGGDTINVADLTYLVNYLFRSGPRSHLPLDQTSNRLPLSPPASVGEEQGGDSARLGLPVILNSEDAETLGECEHGP